jgi:hypothetical protein
MRRYVCLEELARRYPVVQFYAIDGLSPTVIGALRAALTVPNVSS